MIWISFALLAGLAVILLFFGFVRRSPILLFLSAILLMSSGMIMFGEGVDIPSQTTLPHTVITTQGSDFNSPIFIDANVSLVNYNAQSDITFKILAYLSLVFGLILSSIGLIYFAI